MQPTPQTFLQIVLTAFLVGQGVCIVFLMAHELLSVLRDTHRNSSSHLDTGPVSNVEDIPY